MTREELIKSYDWYGPHLAYLGCDVEFAPIRADLRGADLTRADLRGANLTRANLTRADLTDANLTGANLRGADLRGADLDFSCWPLWCGSLHVIVDENQARQLAFHLTSVLPESVTGEWVNGLIEFANGWGGIERHLLNKIER